MDTQKVIKDILKDTKVELDDEFDQNFERKAFFDRKWAPLSKNYNPTTGSMLMRTGFLRKSISSHIVGHSIVYTSSVPYATLMNEGGVVKQNFVPSAKMRRWAFAKFKETKDPKYKGMALCKRIKRTFRVPARPFIGDHPEVHRIINDVASGIIAHATREDLIREYDLTFRTGYIDEI